MLVARLQHLMATSDINLDVIDMIILIMLIEHEPSAEGYMT